MVEKWDGMGMHLARIQAQLDDLERRMMNQEKREMPAPIVR